MTPPFVKSIDGIWCLAKDGWTTPEIEKCGNLNWHDYFAQVREALIQRDPQRTRIVVDVGAFIGDTAKWFEDFPLITFEPQRDAFMCLTHNIQRGLHYPFPVGNGERVKLSFGEGGNMGGRWSESGEDVRTIRIGDLGLPSLGLLKIDVEGWEPKVLEGAMETIAKYKPIVVAEINEPALKRFGFSATSITEKLPGWTAKEIFRYGDNLRDVMFTL